MIREGTGGQNTNVSGLKFERELDAKTAFSKLKGYEVRGDELFFQGEKLAEFYKKHDLYKKLLPKYKIEWAKILCKKMLPDEAIFVLKINTLYIIEKKYQDGSGSVDEKIQTCDFKKKQYKRLLHDAKIRIEYCYVLNDWFNQYCYKDVLDYIRSVDCNYYFNEIPFSYLGLPDPLE